MIARKSRFHFVLLFGPGTEHQLWHDHEFDCLRSAIDANMIVRWQPRLIRLATVQRCVSILINRQDNHLIVNSDLPALLRRHIQTVIANVSPRSHTELETAFASL